MARKLALISACALAFVIAASACAQDSSSPSPSLGDIARQAQKDKASQAAATLKPAGKVITNDDLPSSPGGDSATLGGGLGQIPTPPAASKPGASLSPAEKLARVEAVIDKLDTLDRSTLVRNALSGNDIQFPGRDRWEEKLFAAKQDYVVQGRELLQKAREIIDSAEDLKGNQDPNDPRVKEISARLQSLIRDAVKMDSTFQAVIIEGRDLAAQASEH